VNYIKLINQFWEVRERLIAADNIVINDRQAFLYFFLLSVCNDERIGGRWRNPFQISNKRICAILQISESSLIETRAALKKNGLIDFIGGNKQFTPIYKIGNLFTDEEINGFGKQSYLVKNGFANDFGKQSHFTEKNENSTANDFGNQSHYTQNGFANNFGNQSLLININSKQGNPSLGDINKQTSASYEAGAGEDAEALLKNKKSPPTPPLILRDAQDDKEDLRGAQDDKRGAQDDKGDKGGKKKQVDTIYQKCVDVWFEVYELHYKIKPTYGAVEGKDLKAIVANLERRCFEKKLTWDIGYAENAFKKFLECARMDKWICDNFLLANLKRQFDKIIQYGINANKSGRTALTSINHEGGRKNYLG